MFTISKRHSGCKWKMMKTSLQTQILEVHHFEPGLAQSPQSQWRDLRLTWGSKGKKVGWKLEGGWTWLGPPSKFQHISVPTRNLNLTLLLVITKIKGLEIFGEALGYLWIDQWIQRHWGRLRFRDFQLWNAWNYEAEKQNPFVWSTTQICGKSTWGVIWKILVSRSRNGYKKYSRY